MARTSKTVRPSISIESTGTWIGEVAAGHALEADDGRRVVDPDLQRRRGRRRDDGRRRAGVDEELLAELLVEVGVDGDELVAGIEADRDRILVAPALVDEALEGAGLVGEGRRVLLVLKELLGPDPFLLQDGDFDAEEVELEVIGREAGWPRRRSRDRRSRAR